METEEEARKDENYNSERANMNVRGNVISADYSSPYNEFLVDRYSETGQPLKPNYIVTRDGNITKDMMRHAKFFGIPILNINDEVYQSKQEAELMKNFL